MKLKNILNEGKYDYLEKIVKKYGGELAKKWKGTGIYFSFPVKDFDDYATPGGITQNMGLLKKNMNIAKKQAEKAGKHLDKLYVTAPGPDKQKAIEDYDVAEKSPTGVYGKVWLWVMV